MMGVTKLITGLFSITSPASSVFRDDTFSKYRTATALRGSRGLNHDHNTDNGGDEGGLSLKSIFLMDNYNVIGENRTNNNNTNNTFQCGRSVSVFIISPDNSSEIYLDKDGYLDKAYLQFGSELRFEDKKNNGFSIKFDPQATLKGPACLGGYVT